MFFVVVLKKRKPRAFQVNNSRSNGNGFCDMKFPLLWDYHRAQGLESPFVSTGGGQSQIVGVKRSLRCESGVRAKTEGRSTARPALGQDPKATCQTFAQSLGPL